jgi:hypothetical protein
MIVGLGLVVVGMVALLCPRFGKIGGAFLGLICGLLPSALIIALGLIVARHDLAEWVGDYAGALIVAVPSGIAGGVAGIICSGHKKMSVTS